MAERVERGDRLALLWFSHVSPLANLLQLGSVRRRLTKYARWQLQPAEPARCLQILDTESHSRLSAGSRSGDFGL